DLPLRRSQGVPAGPGHVLPVGAAQRSAQRATGDVTVEEPDDGLVNGALVTDEQGVILPRQLGILRPGNVLGEVTAIPTGTDRSPGRWITRTGMCSPASSGRTSIAAAQRVSASTDPRKARVPLHPGRPLPVPGAVGHRRRPGAKNNARAPGGRGAASPLI